MVTNVVSLSEGRLYLRNILEMDPDGDECGLIEPGQVVPKEYP
jgi:hypothetical protein